MDKLKFLSIGLLFLCAIFLQSCSKSPVEETTPTTPSEATTATTPQAENPVTTSTETAAQTPAPAATEPGTQTPPAASGDTKISRNAAPIPDAQEYSASGDFDMSFAQGYQETPDSPVEIEFGFVTENPKPGTKAVLSRNFQTEPGKTYKLSLEIYDRYQPDTYPNSVFQKVAIDGEEVYSHDISSPAFFGWGKVEKTFTAKNDSTKIEIYLEAGNLRDWNWGVTSRSRIRNLSVKAE